ncbi:MAG: oligosaccharide flippase family protein [Bacteroidota bacterium]|nr:oligosaccharide flippase family protein [Bacteroidota bacterium]
MSIARKALVGVLWSSGSNYISQAIGVLAQAVLGRLILAQEYGLFATANSIIQFVFILSAFSFNISVIQSVEERDRLYSTAFVLNIALCVVSLVMTGVAVIGYSLFRALTATEVTVIFALAVANILNLLGQHFDAILQRNLEFRKISVIALLMNTVNPLLAVALAFSGAGVWSMVAGQIAAGVVFLGGSSIMAGWKVSVSFSRETAAWFLRLGWRYLGSRSLEVVYTELDRIVIKRMNSYEQVGIYDRANLAARYPSRVVNPAINSVALPLYAKVKTESRMLSEAYALVNFFLLRILLPLALVFLLVPDLFMQAVFGGRWLPAGPVLRVLALYAVLYPVSENLKVLFYALGEPGVVAKIRFIQIVVYVPCLVALVSLHGIVGAAWALVVGITAMTVAFLLRTRRTVSFQPMKTVGVPLLFAALTAVVFLLVPRPHIGHPIPALLFAAMEIFLIFCIWEMIFERKIVREKFRFVRDTLKRKEPVGDRPLRGSAEEGR